MKSAVVMHRKAYIFLFQVQEVVDGFIHKLGTTCDGHQVWVCSSTLGKPEINLKKIDNQAMSNTGYTINIKWGDST